MKHVGRCKRGVPVHSRVTRTPDYRPPVSRAVGRDARRALGRIPALRRKAGFTLIELLIAITILAVVAILAWRGLDQIVRGREVVTQVMADERLIAQAYDQIGSDLRAAATDDETGRPGDMAIRVGGNTLQILRYMNLPDRAPRLQMIRYGLSSGRLTRYASQPLANVAEVRAAMGAASRATGVPDGWSRVELMGGVASMRSLAWLNDKGWTQNQGELADAVRKSTANMNTPLSSATPLFRTVTGVQVDITMASTGDSAKPFIRRYMVGQ